MEIHTDLSVFIIYSTSSHLLSRAIRQRKGRLPIPLAHSVCGYWPQILPSLGGACKFISWLSKFLLLHLDVTYRLQIKSLQDFSLFFPDRVMIFFPEWGGGGRKHYCLPTFLPIKYGAVGGRPSTERPLCLHGSGHAGLWGRIFGVINYANSRSRQMMQLDRIAKRARACAGGVGAPGPLLGKRFGAGSNGRDLLLPLQLWRRCQSLGSGRKRRREGNGFSHLFLTSRSPSPGSGTGASWRRETASRKFEFSLVTTSFFMEVGMDEPWKSIKWRE